MKLCVLFPGAAGVRGSGLLMSLFLSSLLSRVSLETPLEPGSEPWSQQWSPVRREPNWCRAERVGGNALFFFFFNILQSYFLFNDTLVIITLFLQFYWDIIDMKLNYFFIILSQAFWASLVAQRGKNLPAMRGTWVQSLDWEDPWRREGYPLRYSCLDIPWTEEPGGLQSMGSKSQTRSSD